MRTMYFKRVTSEGNVRYAKLELKRNYMTLNKWKNGKHINHRTLMYDIYKPQEYIEHLLDMGYKEI